MPNFPNLIYIFLAEYDTLYEPSEFGATLLNSYKAFDKHKDISSWECALYISCCVFGWSNRQI